MTRRARLSAGLAVLALGVCGAILLGTRNTGRPGVSPVTEITLAVGNVTAGASVSGLLTLTARRPLTARSVGIAVRGASGKVYDYPGTATNVSLGAERYTFHSAARTFPAGEYRVYGFWQDATGVYHSLPSRSLRVAPAGVARSAGRRMPYGIPGAWTLKLADEFDRGGLDSTRWRAGWFGSGVSGPADSNEQACYDSRNVRFPGDGSVHLLVTSRHSTCKEGTVRPYTGALLSSNPADGRPGGGYEYTYGVLEARVYVPAAGSEVANWPAVWTDSQHWPATGENDVMEGLSGQACFHFRTLRSRVKSCATGSFTGWHTFASDWEPGTVAYYFDGAKVGEAATGIGPAPMYLVLDNTVSASIGGATVAPADMRVDYIRVWQH